MRAVILIIFLYSGLLFAQTNPKHIWVNGYTTSGGTYVDGYYRTAPNSTVNDNFSTIGNTNPYTGEAGYVPRDGAATPTYTSGTYNSGYKPSTSSYNYPSKPLRATSVTTYQPSTYTSSQSSTIKKGGKYFSSEGRSKSYTKQTVKFTGT
jgi:hypothetical protein